MSDLHGGPGTPGTDGASAVARRGRRVRPGAVPDARPGEQVAPAPSSDGALGRWTRQDRDEVFDVDAARTPLNGVAAVPVHETAAPPTVPPTVPPAVPSTVDTSVPDDASDLDASEPDASEPYASDVDAAEPYATDLDAAEPHAAELDATETSVEEVFADQGYPAVDPEEGYAEEGYADDALVEEHDLDTDDDPDVGYHEDPRRSRRRGRTAVALVICLALLGGAVYAGWSFLSPIVDRLTAGDPPAEDYPGPGTGEVDVVIEPGDTGGAIGDALVEAGVVASRAAFVAQFTATPEAASLQPGTYRLRQEMKASDALSLLLDPTARRSIQVAVREGLWVSEMLPMISAETGFPVEELQAALADPAVGLPPESGGDPEGYLFPATYDFEPDVTPVEIFQAMVARHQQAMDDVGVPPEQRRDVLIRASIVQGEASRPEDLPRVARVIQNRLDRGETLGMDSTVGYVVQKRNLDLTQSDLETDSPYNTRVNPGLPPGPINNPGEAAIAAAFTPAEGDWLYFVTVNGDTGETVFTSDYDEFLAAKEQFQQWLAENE